VLATEAAAGAQAGRADPAPGDRPWWESDPRFAGRFQPVDDGSE